MLEETPEAATASMETKAPEQPLTLSHQKLVLLGDTSVGKSCIVVRFVRGEFHASQEPTIGAAFLTQSIKTENGIVKFEIWDTAGQERYRSLAPMYYRGAGAALVVFDLTSKDSFQGAQKWISELKQRGEKDLIIALAGNKADLVDKREVADEEVQQYAADHKLIYRETSAKTALNLEDIFKELANKLANNKKQKGAPGATNDASKVSLGGGQQSTSNVTINAGCC